LGRPSSSEGRSILRAATDDDALHDPLSARPEAVDRLAEEIDALLVSELEPEVAAIAAEELRLLRLGVPVEEEPLPEPDTPDYAELVAKGRAALEWVERVSIGDLMPSEEEMNAMSDEEQAWFAGLPAPPPRLSFATSPAAPKPVDVPRAVRVESRPREHRARAGRSRARSPGRPSADDDPDPVDRRRREAAAP